MRKSASESRRIPWSGYIYTYTHPLRILQALSTSHCALAAALESRVVWDLNGTASRATATLSGVQYLFTYKETGPTAAQWGNNAMEVSTMAVAQHLIPPWMESRAYLSLPIPLAPWNSESELDSLINKRVLEIPMPGINKPLGRS